MIDFQVKIQNQFYSKMKQKKVKQDLKKQTSLFPTLAPHTNISPDYLLRFKRNYSKKLRNKQKQQSFPTVSKPTIDNSHLNSSLYKQLLANLLKPAVKKIKSQAGHIRKKVSFDIPKTQESTLSFLQKKVIGKKIKNLPIILKTQTLEPVNNDLLQRAKTQQNIFSTNKNSKKKFKECQLVNLSFKLQKKLSKQKLVQLAQRGKRNATLFK